MKKIISKSLVFFLLVSFLTLMGGLNPDKSWADTYIKNLSGYPYAKKIVIDHTKIGQDLTNFPLTVYLNSSNFDFTKAKEDGTDIRFTDSSMNLLSYARDEYSNTLNSAVFDVKIPTVSCTTDTTIYMWYGNSTASDGQNASNVFDSNYIMVLHMGDSLVDCTGKGNNGTATGTTVVNTSFGKARSFNGSSDYMSVPYANLGLGTNPFTILAFVQPNLVNSAPHHIFAKQSTSSPYTGFVANINSSNKLSSECDTTSVHLVNGVTTVNANTNYVFTTKRESNLYKILIDGVLDSSVSTDMGSVDYNTNLIIGRHGTATNYFSGLIYSFRISNIARSDAWVKAESLSLKNSLVSLSDALVDSTAPTITATAQTSWGSTNTITTTITDTQSGIAVQKWALGSQTASYFTSNGTIYTGTTFSVSSNGIYTVYAKDNVGNESVQTVTVSYIDTTPPTINTPALSEIGSTAIKIAPLATDYTAMTYLYNRNGTDIGTWTNTSPYTDTGLTPNTQYTYKYKAKDSAGNVSAYSSPVTVRTFAQTPVFTTGSTTYSSIDLTFSDQNPANTKYQIMCGEKYINQSGVLTGTPTWITRPANTIKVIGLERGTTYNFQARAKNEDGIDTNFSSPVSSATSNVAVPGNVSSAAITCTITNDTAVLNWDEIQGALSYEVEADGEIKNVGLETTYTHSDLLPDTQHTYRVRAKNAGGYSSWSNLVVVQTTNDAPGEVTGVIATASNDTLTLNWDKTLNAMSYIVDVEGCTTSAIKTNAASVFGLKPDTTYTYKVKAVNLAGESEWSDTGTITTYLLKEPEIAYKQSESNEIKIGWNKVKDATAYQMEIDGQIIQVDNVEDSTYTQAGIVYTHEGLEPLEAHTYKVRAIRAEGNSSWSKEVTLETLPQRLEVPVNFRGSATENEIDLNWDAVEGAIGYDIEVDGIVVENDAVTSYQYTELEPYTVHTYRVRAVSDEIESLWSDYITVKTVGGIPAEPKNLEIINSRGIANITWDPVNGADSYDIEINGEITEKIAANSFTHRKIAQIISGASIYIETAYRIRSVNNLGCSDWTGYFINNVIKGKAEKNKELDLGLTASNIMDFSKYTLNVTYNPDVLTVTDLCAYSTEKELRPGQVEGTDIEILSYEPGHIVFKVNKIVDEGYLWTGIINNIKFTGNITGGTTLTYRVECEKDAFENTQGGTGNE